MDKLQTCPYLPSSKARTSLRQRMSLGGSSFSRPGDMVFSETAHFVKSYLQCHTLSRDALVAALRCACIVRQLPLLQLQTPRGTVTVSIAA